MYTQWWLERFHFNNFTEQIPFTSVVGFSSLHEKFWKAELNTQIERGAKYLHAILTYWSCLRQEIIAPDRWRDGEMMSMHMYRNVFNTSRVFNIINSSN